MNIPHQILKTADKTINNRASDRDVEAERSMAGTVAAFNALHGTNLTESQGWSFMILLKLKRGFTGPYKEDDWVDGAAYEGLCAEAFAREKMGPNDFKSYENSTKPQTLTSDMIQKLMKDN